METLTQEKKLLVNWRHVFLSYPFLLLGCLFILVYFFPPKFLGKPTTFSSEFSTTALLQEVNRVRQLEGRAALQENQQLQVAAQEKIFDMAEQQYWAHQAPDGQQASDFVQQEAYLFNELGENLARDLDNPEAIVTAWLNSESHRRNLLAEEFSQTGLAAGKISLLGRPTIVVVEIFAQPAARSLQVAASDSMQVLPAIGKTSVQQDNEFLVPLTSETLRWLSLACGGIFIGIFCYQRLRLPLWSEKKLSAKDETGASL